MWGTNLNRSVAILRPLGRSAQPWIEAALAITLAIGAGVLLVQLLMSPPARELRTLAGYLTLSGVATMAAGWVALQAADRVVGLGLQVKAFVGAAIGAGVALLNVLIVAQLMFVSTAHDLRLLLALVAFSAVVTVFFSFRVAGTIAHRVEAVASGIRTLAAGDYGARVTVPGKDEVARLAADVNTLAQRLGRAAEEREGMDRERRDLTAAISHDLRTPLASMRAMVEALDDHVVEDPGEVTRYYGRLRREIERLSRMIDDVFELARLDAGGLRLDTQPVGLQEVAADVVDAMQARARQQRVSLSLCAGPELADLTLDGTRIERALFNLVRNALEHTPAGGRIDVSLADSGTSVLLRVADDGEGIGQEDLPRIWDRFYRAEKSRNRASDADEGAGLGLAIVRGIVEAHGGTVHAASEPGRGTEFEVRLPRDAPLVINGRPR